MKSFYSLTAANMYSLNCPFDKVSHDNLIPHWWHQVHLHVPSMSGPSRVFFGGGATFMMPLQHFLLLVPYLESIALYSDCESPTQVAPSSTYMEIIQKFSTFELDCIHFRIHCKILLSLWGPSGALPYPTPLSCCNPTRPHVVSGQLINSWVCLKQSIRLEGNVSFLWLLNYGMICPCTLYSPLHCLFLNLILKPTPLQDQNTQCSGSLKCLLGVLPKDEACFFLSAVGSDGWYWLPVLLNFQSN